MKYIVCIALCFLLFFSGILKANQAEVYKKLPGGVFNAPKIHKHIVEITQKLKQAAGIENTPIDIYLASSSEINAYVSKEQNQLYIVFTKGLIDFMTQQSKAMQYLEPVYAQELHENSGNLIAAIAAHELAHIVLNHQNKTTQTRGVYFELDADTMAISILYKAGYPPSSLIKIFEALDKIKSDKNLLSLLSKAIQRHPNPKFRKAHVEDLVYYLEVENEARLALGFPTNSHKNVKPRSIVRGEVEKISGDHTGQIAKLFMNTASGGYLTLGFRDKLNFIEQQLITLRYYQDKATHAKASVILIREYLKLVASSDDFKNINLIVGSFSRLEQNLSKSIAGFKGESRDENVKAAVAEVKYRISKKQLSLLKRDHPEGLTLDNFDKWAIHLDEPVAYGELMASVNRAESMEELIRLVHAKKENDIKFKEIFDRPRTELSQLYHNHKAQFYERAAIRALALTKNMEQTLNFIQTYFPLQKKDDSLVHMNHNDTIIAGLLYYALTHEGIAYGDFIQRLQKPESRIDKIYSRIFNGQYSAHSSLEALKIKTGGTVQKIYDDEGERTTVIYGMGKIHNTIKMTPELASLLEFTLRAHGVQSIVEALVKKTYSIADILDILLEQPKNQKEKWNQLKTEIPKSQLEHRQDMHSRLYWLNTYISEHHPEWLSLNGVSQDLTYFKENISKVKGSFLENLLISFANAKPYQVDQRNIRLTIPKLTQSMLSEITLPDYYRLFDLNLKLYYEAAISANIHTLVQEKEAFQNYLQKLDGHKALISEIMPAYNKIIELGLAFSQRKIISLPLDYFIALRKIKFFYDTIESIERWRWSFREQKGVYSALNDLCGGFSSDFSRELFKGFMLFSEAYVAEYLKSPDHSIVSEHFRYAILFTKRILFYHGFDEAMTLSETSTHNLKQNIRKMIKDGWDTLAWGSENNDKLLAELFFTESEKNILIPFSDEIKKDFKKNHIFSMNMKKEFWAWFAQQALAADDPIQALLFTMSYHNNISEGEKDSEKNARIFFSLLMRALRLVKTKTQMDQYAGLISVYLVTSGKLKIESLTELRNEKEEYLANAMTLKYREYFFDELSKSLTRFDSWSGTPINLKNSFSDFALDFWKKIYEMSAGRDFINPTIQKFLGFSVKQIGQKYLESLNNPNAMQIKNNLEDFIKILRQNTPWSEYLDEFILNHIKTQLNHRARAFEFSQNILSPAVREKAYTHILEKYGEPKTDLFSKIKAYTRLYFALKKAEKYWGKENIEKFKKIESIEDVLRFANSAWAQIKNKNANDLHYAEQSLIDLYKASQAVNSIKGGEVNNLFLESSKHKDGFLEDYVKQNSTSLHQLSNINDFKSRNSESPYHFIVKAMYDISEEVVSRFTPTEGAKIALYLAQIEELPGELQEKIKLKGTNSRAKMIKRHGLWLNITEIKDLLKAAHVEERLQIYKALFYNGFLEDSAAEAFLINQLLLSDKDMPIYLKRFLNIYLTTINKSEKANLLSWILANGSDGKLKGPDILKLLVERGGVLAAKIAQLAASHGLKLSREYQDVLEVFKSRAQKVDKIEFMRWLAERLPREIYDQIKTLDVEVGSGSIKIGYSATLKSGRKVIIMLSRNHIISKVYREFQISERVIQRLMADPELRMAALPGLETEAKRIIKGEMKILGEAHKMRLHKQAYEARPLLVKWFSGTSQVYFPQPLKDKINGHEVAWVGEDYLIEEYVEAKNFMHLPQTQSFGWSKEKLAKAAIDEILNQLLSYTDPKHLPEGKVILDLDPHEENQLAQSGLLGSKRKMVDIDLGQSQLFAPETIKDLVKLFDFVDKRDLQSSISLAKNFLQISSHNDEVLFKHILQTQMGLNNDPVEILSSAIDSSQQNGVLLKQEYLAFQKLFATIVGLKKYINEPDYIKKRVKTILALRVISQPRKTLSEIPSCPQWLNKLNVSIFGS